MMSLSRMIPLGLVVIGLCTPGCSTWPSFHGIQSRSARAGDGASLGEPKADGTGSLDNGKLARKRGVRPGDAMHYYSNQRIAMVARPARYSASELARVEVWWTDNNGFHWHKAGRFKQGQAFFPLNVKEDGDYGIRFVGPGEEPAQRVLAFPERTYHVDTVQPEVQVLVHPEQADYHVGDLVSIEWMVQDFQLARHPVTVEVLYDRSDTGTSPIEFQRDLPDEGSVTYSIPPEALGREITFRIEAKDRTGNLGVAYTGTLRVVVDPMATAVAEAEIEMNENENESDSTDRFAIVARDAEIESNATVSVEDEKPVLVVGPILVPVEDGAEETVAAATIDSDLIVADTLSDTTAEAQRARTEAMLAEATRLAAEMKLRVTMLASRVIDAMGGAVNSWVASAKMASARDRETTQSPPPVTVEAPVAVAVIEPDDTDVGDAADAEENLDPAPAAPTFAVVERPIDDSAASEALKETRVANAAQTEPEETNTRSSGSMFLEIGPQIVMSEDPFEEEPAPGLPSSDESTAVAISDTDETDQLDVSPDAPEMNHPQPDATSLAAADDDMADEAEASSPDRVAQGSSDLPFATAIARLPAIDSQMMDEESAPEDFPADDATTRGPDITELPADATEPTQEEDAHPQVSALASADQQTDGEEQTDDARVFAENLPDDEQLADATMAEEADDENDELEKDSATIETVASAEQSEDEESFLPALSIESLTAIDPTRGNGLLVPMPATLEENQTPPAYATAHPWRILGRQSDSMRETIWALPERQSDVSWRPVFTGRFLADDPALRDVASPGNATLPTLAGTTEEMIDGESSDEP